MSLLIRFKGSCIPRVQVLFGGKFKGLIETAPICKLLSQRCRNISAEAGAITLPVDRRDISFMRRRSMARLGMLAVYACGTSDALQKSFKGADVQSRRKIVNARLR
jgi:hypothetical protein